MRNNVRLAWHSEHTQRPQEAMSLSHGKNNFLQNLEGQASVFWNSCAHSEEMFIHSSWIFYIFCCFVRVMNDLGLCFKNQFLLNQVWSWIPVYITTWYWFYWLDIHEKTQGMRRPKLLEYCLYSSQSIWSKCGILFGHHLNEPHTFSISFSCYSKEMLHMLVTLFA